MPENYFYQTGKWWITKGFAVFYFVCVKRMHVMVFHPLQYAVVGIVCLYQHPTGAIHPTGTPAYLLHKLECTLIHTKIGVAKQVICTQYAHQGHRRKIEPFDYH